MLVFRFRCFRFVFRRRNVLVTVQVPIRVLRGLATDIVRVDGGNLADIDVLERGDDRLDAGLDYRTAGRLEYVRQVLNNFLVIV